MTPLKTGLKLLLGIPALSVYRKLRAAMAYAERRQLLRAMAVCGRDFEIVPPWDIRGPEHISIGDDVFIGPSVLLIADQGAEIRLGSHIMFGPRVRVIADDHRFDLEGVPIKHSGYGAREAVTISDDVWIGAGATILKGVIIGKGAIVGAGAVVTRSVGEYEIWAGNPARKVRDRFALKSVGAPS